MWGVGGLQVYRICCRSEVVEVRSNYKKSYSCSFRNSACGDSIGSNWIEKDWVGVRPGLVWRNGEEGWCDLVCVKLV